MADLVIEDTTATISECEINGVYAANSWKFIDSKRNPEHTDRMFISCCSSNIQNFSRISGLTM
jgi:hypothetical protein